jgi:hypothetical protein
MQGKEKTSTKKKNVNCVLAFLQFLKTHAQAMHNKLVHLGVCWQDFNLHKPNGVVEQPVKNLETKWAPLSMMFSKFVGVYGVMASLNESGTSFDDMFH